MVYHEVRRVKEKAANYLVQNSRVGDRFSKTSKFIGYGKLSKNKVSLEKHKFEEELREGRASENLSVKQIREIETLRKIYFERLKSYDKENFEEAFFTELTYDSNAIEGSTLTLADTSLVINEGIVPEGKTLREINEAQNHLEAVKFVRDYDGDLNEAFILRLHKIILKDIAPRFAGVYRTGNVRIRGSDVRLPGHEKVAMLMGNLIHWYKENKKVLHPFELAIIFSVKFVTIHPFADGNGRVSRLLMNFILGKFGYPWINIRVKNRARYLAAVRAGNDEAYSDIVGFCLEELGELVERM